jgi:hypothetical protein
MTEESIAENAKPRRLTPEELTEPNFLNVRLKEFWSSLKAVQRQLPAEEQTELEGMKGQLGDALKAGTGIEGTFTTPALKSGNPSPGFAVAGHAA